MPTEKVSAFYTPQFEFYEMVYNLQNQNVRQQTASLHTPWSSWHGLQLLFIHPHLLPALFSSTFHCFSLQLGLNWHQFLAADSTHFASFSFPGSVHWNLPLSTLIFDLLPEPQLKQWDTAWLSAVFLQLNEKNKDIGVWSFFSFFQTQPQWLDNAGAWWVLNKYFQVAAQGCLWSCINSGATYNGIVYCRLPCYALWVSKPVNGVRPTICQAHLGEESLVRKGSFIRGILWHYSVPT